MDSFHEQCRKEAEKTGLDSQWLLEMALDMLSREGMEDKFLFEIRYNVRQTALAQLPRAILGALAQITPRNAGTESYALFIAKTLKDEHRFHARSDEYKTEFYRECRDLLQEVKRSNAQDEWVFSNDGHGTEALKLLDLILSK